MRKRALLVGINDYRRVSDLRGCVNDVTNLRLVLKHYRGFTNDDIRVLIDQRATKSAIIERLNWLAEGARAGDYLLFHFSGHGSQIRDRGILDELNDGLDEILCPYDMDWDGTFITDDDLREHLQVPDGVRMEVVLDCCHAGADEDEAEEVAKRDTAPELEQRPRFLEPPIDIRFRHDGDSVRFRSRLMRSVKRDGSVLWAGCGAGQTSADALIGGVAWGAFTHALCGAMRTNQGALARAKLLESVRGTLAGAGFAQRPELEADQAAVLGPAFSGEQS
jgi:metacaspase-1